MENNPGDEHLSKLVLIGGGGHCKSVIDAAKRMNCFNEIVITDPNIKQGTQVLGCTVAGTDDCLKKLHQQGFEYAFVTIGSVKINLLREKIADKAAALGYTFPVIRDPSAIVSGSAIIGDGTFIGKNVVINAETKIGRHCIINTGAIIEHECSIGDFTHISVGTILCGEVTVKDNCMIGAGTTVIQCININKNVVIGANSTVLADVEENMKCYGIVNNRGGGYSSISVYMPSFSNLCLEVA